MQRPIRLDHGRPASLRERFKEFFLLNRPHARNAALEGVRGYSVLLVVYLHCVGKYLTDRGVDVFSGGLFPIWSPELHASAGERLWIFSINLHYAVDIFFVMSAFLITRLTLKQEGTFRYAHYLRQRIARIYPPFLVALALALLVEVAWLHTLPFNGKDVVKNLFFLNGFPDNYFHTMAYIFPSWSLFVEFGFYLAFPGIYFLIRQARSPQGENAFLAALGLLSVVLLTHWCLPRACVFFFGIALGLQNDERLASLARRISTGAVVSYYLVLTTLHAAGLANWNWFTPLFAIAISMLIIKSCFDTGPLNWFFSRKSLRLLGNISFSLYLVHSFAIEIVNHWAQPASWGMHPLIGAPLFLAMSFLASLGIAVFVFATVERWHFRKPNRQPEPAAKILLDATPSRLAA